MIYIWLETLVDDPVKTANLYLGEQDISPREIILPFIPKTDEDYISYKGNVYRTQNVIYKDKDVFSKKNEILLIVEEEPINTIGEFQRHFFRQKLDS